MFSKCCVPFISALLLIISCSSDNPHNRNTLQKYKWIDFKWRTSEISGKIYNKAAIEVPFKIDKFSPDFVIQLDLGSSVSIFYENTLKSYYDVYCNLMNKIDSTNTMPVIYENNCRVKYFSDLQIVLDTIKFKNPRIGMGYGLGDIISHDSVYNKKSRLIGLLGADFFNNKILIIDYKNERISITDTLYNDFIQNIEFQQYLSSKTSSRVLLPIKLSNTTYSMMFDTGCSIFSLILKTDLWKLNTDFKNQNTMKVKGVSRFLYFFQSKALTDAFFGDMKLPKSFYYCVPQGDDFFIRENISGIIGNAFFLDKIVIVDFKNKRFGVVKD